MFALRGLRYGAAQNAVPLAVRQSAAALQQARHMSGGDDEDEAMYVNWWDAPTDPNIWHRHHLAWFGVAFWGTVFYLGFGGKSKPKAPEPAKQSPDKTKA